MPTWLTPGAQAHWQYIVPLLLERRTLTALDAGPLSMLCSEFDSYEQAMLELNALRAAGRKFTDHYINHPRAVMKSAFARYEKLAVQFGLTPAARERIKPAAKPKDPEPTGGGTSLRIAN